MFSAQVPRNPVFLGFPSIGEAFMPTWQVILLGVIEGLTEFIPVSSTGHVLLAGYFLGFDSPGKTFEVLIQLGAIVQKNAE